MFTALADGWLEVGLTEGKVTVYINVTQKKTTHIAISSGELSSFIFRTEVNLTDTTLPVLTTNEKGLIFRF